METALAKHGDFQKRTGAANGSHLGGALKSFTLHILSYPFMTLRL